MAQGIPVAIPIISSPLEMLWSDLRLMKQYIHILPLALWPSGPLKPTDELYLRNRESLEGLVTQVLQTILSLIVLVCIVISIFNPVPSILLLVLFFIIRIKVFCYGYTKYVSQEGAVFEDETWVYINGICCDPHWLGMNCELLARMFGRKIYGFHNPTFGPIYDLADCILQRCFSHTTEDFRQLYDFISKLLDAKRKVVLIAHSQGGIIASQVVDHLIATSNKNMHMLEVYTFGSAANHFNGEGCLGHIEHFANDEDIVARTGVLTYSKLDPARYAGRVYTAQAYGHLLNMHYLLSTFTKGNEAMNSRLATYLQGMVGVSTKSF